MKYQLNIDIKLPRAKVIELMDNPDNMKHWQPGLVSFEPMSGKPGEVGAKSLIKYEMGKRNIEMIETVIKRDLPEEFLMTYETKGMWNQVNNYFIAVDKNTTQWKSENEFKAQGIYRIMTWLMPGLFKKQSYKYMTDFKKFAESHKE